MKKTHCDMCRTMIENVAKASPDHRIDRDGLQICVRVNVSAWKSGLGDKTDFDCCLGCRIQLARAWLQEAQMSHAGMTPTPAATSVSSGVL